MASRGRGWGIATALAALATAVVAGLWPAAAAAAPTTHTLSPTADTFLRSNQSNANFGTDTKLLVDPSARQSMLQFDISGVPLAQIVVSAKLRLYVVSSVGGSVQAHRVTSGWTELSATWGNMSSNFNGAVAGSVAVTAATTGYVEIDVLDLVRTWRSGTTNQGFMITAPSGSGSTQMSSREEVVGQRPELVIVATAEPSYTVSKLTQVISDPANGTSDPKRMPGALIQYSVTVSSTNSNVSDSNSIALVEAVPSQATLYVGDLGGAGSGPVAFTNGSPGSGLTYTRATDLLFSNNGGSSYTYTPLPDADGYDGTVTHIRIAPKGIFAGSTGSGDPSFSYAFRAKNK